MRGGLGGPWERLSVGVFRVGNGVLGVASGGALQTPHAVMSWGTRTSSTVKECTFRILMGVG